MSLKKLVSAVAPFLGGLIGGPIGSRAGVVLSELLFGKDAKGKSDEEIEKALASAPPDILLKLKEIDSKERQQYAILGLDEKKIAALDRDSARKREIEVKDSVPAILAVLLTIGFFAILFYLIKFPIEPSSKDLIEIMTGSLGAAWLAAIMYYFGSSHGSLVQTRVMGKKNND